MTHYKDQFEEIETKNLRMSPLTFNDLEDIYTLTSDQEVAQYMRFKRHENKEQTKALLAEYIESQGCHGLRIIEKVSGKFVGVFIFKQDEKENTHFSLTTFNGKDFWNKGYSTEILQAMRGYAKQQLKAKALSAYVVSNNKGSCKVLEKNDFKVVQTLNFEDLPCPLLIYQITL